MSPHDSPATAGRSCDDVKPAVCYRNAPPNQRASAAVAESVTEIARFTVTSRRRPEVSRMLSKANRPTPYPTVAVRKSAPATERCARVVMASDSRTIASALSKSCAGIRRACWPSTSVASMANQRVDVRPRQQPLTWHPTFVKPMPMSMTTAAASQNAANGRPNVGSRSVDDNDERTSPPYSESPPSLVRQTLRRSPRKRDQRMSTKRSREPTSAGMSSRTSATYVRPGGSPSHGASRVAVTIPTIDPSPNIVG